MATTAENTLPPPFIHVSQIPNFRTIGSHTIPGRSQRTRKEYVYRSGAPTGSTPEAVDKLHELNISTFYDFRSLREIERTKDRIPVTEYPGIKRVPCPVFRDTEGMSAELTKRMAGDDEVASPAALAKRMAAYGEIGPQGFVRNYDEMLHFGKHAFRTVFEHIRDRPTEPLVVHCTAGKDRTGVVVALMLNLVGVPDDVVAEEYALTEIGLKDEIEKWIPHMMKDPSMGRDEESLRRGLGAKKESMIGTLQMFREKWGGAAGYLKDGLGFSEEDVEKIRKNLLENAP